MLLSQDDSRAICDKVLSLTKADDAVVDLQVEDRSHLRFAANSFLTSGRSEDIVVRLTVWADARKGSASTNETSETALQAVVEQAEAFARVSPVDPEYLPTLGPQQYRPTQEYVEATANVDVAARAATIRDIIAACEKDSLVGAGFHQAGGSAHAGATRHGNFYEFRSSLASLSLTARTRQGGGSGYFLRNHFDIARLDTARIAHEAMEKALRSRQPRALDPGVYTVILEPQAVADLLGFFSSFFYARPADEGRSPFSAPGGKTKVGERVFDERLSILSDPWNPEVPASPVAVDGIAAQKFYLARNGVLETLIYSRFWAAKKQKEPSPGPVNVIIQGSAQPASVSDMIRDTKKGLLVSRFWYIRSLDPLTAALTGLTRDGVWLIEDGRIASPVRNFRFNQSLLEMLAPGNVDLIGAPERVGSSEAQGSGAALLPALKIKEFHFSSQSEAV